MNIDKRKHLAEKAVRLKKAWLVAAAFLGTADRLNQTDLVVPQYLTWNNKSLKQHIDDLKDDFEDIAKNILLDWKKSKLSSVVPWFSEQFDAWQQSGTPVFDLGRVHAVEKVVGRLVHRRSIDCPPYAQVLLQGLHGAAIRHPEYHLATDIALLYNLFLDAEAIMEEAERESKTYSSEHSQSLGRSVILACFNLLESFVSGLATAWIMENPGALPEVVEQFKKKVEDKRLSLRKRLIAVTSLITGEPCLLDQTHSPIEPLFGECKQRRDSFVHCEPGPNPTQWGYIKEERFHDISVAAVRKTVDLTCETICLVWKAIHGREKPSWLPQRDLSGRFFRVEVTLRSLDTAAFGGATNNK